MEHPSVNKHILVFLIQEIILCVLTVVEWFVFAVEIYCKYSKILNTVAGLGGSVGCAV